MTSGVGRNERPRTSGDRIERIRARQTPAAGLLKVAGVYNDICSACAILERNGDRPVKAISLSISWHHLHEEIEDAVRRFAEEQSLVVEVGQSNDALVVSLRSAGGAEGGSV